MPLSPRYRLPYGDLDGALTRLDTIIFGGWSPRLEGMVAATRTFAYHGGFNADGSLTADGTIVIPDASTRYVQRTAAGVVTADAVLDLLTKLPMAVVTAAGGLLTHFEDIREVGLWAARAHLAALYGGAAGDLVISVGGVPAILSVGAAPAGYVLTLAGGVPVWAAPSGGGGGGASVFGKTVLQLHFEGANNSVVFTDMMGRVVTPSGNAKISTAQFKFGTSSAVFDGAGDYLTVTAHTSFNLSNVFTIECWVRTTQVGQQYTTLIERDNGAFGAGSWSLLFNRDTANSGKVGFYQSSVNSSAPTLYGVTPINDGAWHHIAVCGIGTEYLLFIDGVLDAQGSSNATFNANNANIVIGKSIYAGRDYNGYLDELRIIKGVAMYTTNFNPPVAAFPDA